MSLYWVLDQGNSRLKLTAYKDEAGAEQAGFWIVNHEDELTQLLQSYAPVQIIQVGHERLPDWALTQLAQCGVPMKKAKVLFDQGPIQVDYAQTLGVDRYLLCVAVRHLFPDIPVLALDAGTCLTANYLTAEGAFIGGAISPGIKLRLLAMEQFTKSLPLVETYELKEWDESLARHTKGNMAAGAVHGWLAEVAWRRQHFLDEYGTHARFIWTGGEVALVQRNLPPDFEYIPDLVARGAMLIAPLLPVA